MPVFLFADQKPGYQARYKLAFASNQNSYMLFDFVRVMEAGRKAEYKMPVGEEWLRLWFSDWQRRRLTDEGFDRVVM